MSTDDLNRPVPVPGILWVVVKWGSGLLATGFVATVVILVQSQISFSGRLAAIEQERDGLARSMQKIELNTEATRESVEELKRDVAVLKARGTP
jgi:hypothetical protein